MKKKDSNNNISKKRKQERNQRIRENKTLRNKRKKMFSQLKKAQPLLKTPVCVQDILEIAQVSPDGIFKVGEDLYSKQYFLNDMNYITKTFEEQRLFFQGWCRLLNAIDCVHFQITVFNKNRNIIEFRNNILYQHKGDIYDKTRNCYNDIIERKVVNGKYGIEQVKFFTITIKRKTFADTRNSFDSIEKNLIREFNALGAPIIPLSTEERLEMLFNFFQMGKESKFDVNFKDCLLEGKDWRNDILPQFLNFGEDPGYFRSDVKYGKAMCIEPDSYPEDDWSDEFFDQLINMQYNSVVTNTYIPIAKTATKNQIESKYMSIGEKIRKQQSKRNKNLDFSSEISYTVQRQLDDIKEMMDEINDNGQKMFWVSTGIILLADTLDKLDEASDSVSLLIENYTCMINEYLYRQHEALNTILPIGARNTDLFRNMITRMCGIMIPFKTQELQQKKHPMYYGANKETGEVILFNRKNLVNGNGFVFGVTGGGKSFTGAKLEMGSVFLNTEDDIIILDPTLEYKDVAETFGGSFIEMSPESPHHINPLHCNVKKLTKENIKNYIVQKSQIICGICEHAMEGEFTSRHRSLVDRAIKNLFYDILEMPVEEREVPIMTDFYAHLRYMEEIEARDLVLSLEVFVSGSMDIFNHHTNVNPDNRVVVYGIRDIGEELESVAMLIILENIRLKILQNFAIGKSTWLYVDEFHVLMEKKFSKGYLIALWKTVRKLGGICTGITQNLSDVVKDRETHKLISNSEYTMMLRIGAGDDQIITDVFREQISNEHLKYVQNATPGEGLIRVGNTVIPLDYKIEKTNPIYDIFNTNFYEKNSNKVS